MTEIRNRTSDREREFYGMREVNASGILIAGPADGESAFKECSDLRVSDSEFRLRYPFWHNDELNIINCKFTDTCRAPLWYTEGCSLSGCSFAGPKALRECSEITASDCVFNSEEFGWMCDTLTFAECEFESNYFLFRSSDIALKNCRMKGKYSFQYTENVSVSHCVLDTKDAFWHSKDTTITDCTVKGEYLGWYSENLTLIRCKISGTQPFCYCEGLKLIDCEMTDTDLSFEYSDVEADVRGEIMSVKNPLSGRIVADGYGAIIRGNSVKDCDCETIVRKKK